MKDCPRNFKRQMDNTLLQMDNTLLTNIAIAKKIYSEFTSFFNLKLGFSC